MSAPIRQHGTPSRERRFPTLAVTYCTEKRTLNDRAYRRDWGWRGSCPAIGVIDQAGNEVQRGLGLIDRSARKQWIRMWFSGRHRHEQSVRSDRSTQSPSESSHPLREAELSQEWDDL